MLDHDTATYPFITYDQQFTTKLDEVIHIHFPLKVVKFNKHKHKKYKWMTHTLLTEIQKRDIKVKEVRKLKRETKAEY